MKTQILGALICAASVFAFSGSVDAQVSSPTCPVGVGLGTCGVGEIQANCVGTRTGYPKLWNSVRYAHWDKFSPRPYYAYGRHGIEAQRTHAWNQQQMQSYAWHCNNSYWQYGRPTALVVPPTAAFQTIYSWGVANTRSVPIYHQFGRPYPGPGVGPAGGAFPAAPYWPSNTTQLGIYPVRSPW